MIDFTPFLCLIKEGRKGESGGRGKERERDRECIQRERLWNWERQFQNGGPVKKALWLRVCVCSQYVCAMVPGCVPLRIIFFNCNVNATCFTQYDRRWTRGYGLYYSVTIVPTPTGRGASLVLPTLNCARHPPNLCGKTAVIFHDCILLMAKVIGPHHSDHSPFYPFTMETFTHCSLCAHC